MATVIIKVKMMPESQDVNLEDVKKEVSKVLIPQGANNISFEEQPIAFGLKALILKTDMPESKGTDLVEEKLSKVKGISSVTIEDYRRAFG